MEMKNFGNRPDFAPDSGRKTHFAQNCPDFAPDSGRKSASRRTVRILPPIPDGNPLRTELSGFCPEFRMETHFGQNCPDFAPNSGWKITSGITVRILPRIPDGKPTSGRKIGRASCSVREGYTVDA